MQEPHNRWKKTWDSQRLTDRPGERDEEKKWRLKGCLAICHGLSRYSFFFSQPQFPSYHLAVKWCGDVRMSWHHNLEKKKDVTEHYRKMSWSLKFYDYINDFLANSFYILHIKCFFDVKMLTRKRKKNMITKSSRKIQMIILNSTLQDGAMSQFPLSFIKSYPSRLL